MWVYSDVPNHLEFESQYSETILMLQSLGDLLIVNVPVHHVELHWIPFSVDLSVLHWSQILTCGHLWSALSLPPRCSPSLVPSGNASQQTRNQHWAVRRLAAPPDGWKQRTASKCPLRWDLWQYDCQCVKSVLPVFLAVRVPFPIDKVSWPETVKGRNSWYLVIVFLHNCRIRERDDTLHPLRQYQLGTAAPQYGIFRHKPQVSQETNFKMYLILLSFFTSLTYQRIFPKERHFYILYQFWCIV